MAVYKEEKTNTWRAVYRYTDWNGERKQTQKRGFKTKREAQAWEREQLNKSTADLDMTFKSFVDLYTADMKTRLKENTWSTKEHIIRTKLLPYFGKLKMCKITAQQIITWQNEMMNHKDEQGKPYSPVYLKTVHNQLSAIFNHAVRYYNLRENPCKKAGSMGKKKNREMLFWTKEEYLKFAEAMMDKPLSFYAFEMLYWCGIREGELLALKPVYGMFIAVRIDTNTAETFRHGIWYTKDDAKQRLDIVPLTLAQFQKYFVAMFEANKAAPEKLRDLIVKCESRRDILEAPAWKQYIDSTVAEKSLEITNGIVAPSGSEIPLVPAGAIVRHVAFGEGQVVALEANFPECPAKTVELPYLRSLPDEVSFCADGKTLLHDRFGEGTVFAYIVVFKNHMMPLTYPATFEAGDMFLV